METSGIAFMVIFYIIYLSVFMAFGVAAYILESLGLYRIAQRRGINKPWLAWIPGGSAWILGCISDQYRYVNYGLVTTRRKKLLTWFIVLFAVLMLFCFITGAIVGLAIVAETMTGAMPDALRVLTVVLLALYVPLIGSAVVYTVISYKSLFDLYRSCKPDLAILFLMLSIFVAPSCAFIFALRNRDEGMPPRIQA